MQLTHWYMGEPLIYQQSSGSLRFQWTQFLPTCDAGGVWWGGSSHLRLTFTSSMELQRTGSVRSSSASSIQLWKEEARLANCRNRSSTFSNCSWARSRRFLRFSQSVRSFSHLQNKQTINNLINRDMTTSLGNSSSQLH